VSQPALPDFISVVAKVKPSVVAINTEVATFDIFNRPSTAKGAGSGWIIDKDGRIITNNHVIDGAKNITVMLADERALPATVIGTDPLNDIAILKVDATNLPAVPVGDSSRLRLGEWVLAIGNPLGMGISAKQGIVSRLGVSISVSSGQTLYDLVEISAAINPGNSGGPLFNMAGEVVGITSAKLSAVGVEGMGYAISSNTARPIIEELITRGYTIRPWLGVVLRSVNQLVALQYRLSVQQGALITEVAAGSPAAKAGLKVGDAIVNVNGKDITSADDLIRAIRISKIGETVTITYWRGNQKNSTSAILMESPKPS
jgi:serine protease Do